MAAFQWRPYVPVATRRAYARKEVGKRRKRGETIEPVEIEGRKIARTFWGSAWCEHLEGFRDYSNRLPRGRTYVRNGSVVHLEIAKGAVRALVVGSELYEVRLAVSTLPRKRWRAVKSRCEGGIGSLLELLGGRLSKGVMEVVTDRNEGLFPLPREIGFECTCPDWATMCKHVAAVCYGVGARLDERPELLFRLRGVDHEELIATDASALVAITENTAAGGRRRIAENDLADVFGIEMSDEGAMPEVAERSRRARTVASASKTGARREASRGGVPRRKRSPPAAASKGKGRSTAAKRRSTKPSPPSSFTGAAVKRLRARLEMSRSELARLLEVSVTTIGNWEGTRGRLGLRQSSLEALQDATGLTLQQARRRLRRQ
jgi:uncharacterized Zn finger protein